MKTKRLRHLFLPLILLLTVAACGAVFAYMFTQTEVKDNQFVPAYVDCEVQETTDDDVTQKSSIRVKNTGNINAYIRLRLVSYWVNDASEIIGKESPTLSVSPTDGWVSGSGNTYYYSESIAPDDLTPEFLSSPLLLDKDEDGNRQVIEVFAEAIQFEPITAVTDSWKVTISNKIITSAP